MEAQLDLEHLDHVDRSPALVPPAYFRWKGAFDILCTLVLLLPALPVMAVLVVIVRMSSPGPGVFRQCRVGRRGRLFTMYKIRTMAQHAESKTGPVWTKTDDPRVTPFGRFLRHWHLDELPQLFNVLKGEMSLIGPRPERPEFVRVLAQQVPDYLDRLTVQPGITGLAQINLPPDTDLNSVRRKQVLDCEYIRTANLWLDIRILTWTTLRLLTVNSQFAARLTGVYHEVRLRDTTQSETTPATRTPEELAERQALEDTVSMRITETVEGPFIGSPREEKNGRSRKQVARKTR